MADIVEDLALLGIKELVEDLRKLPDVHIELCGTWLWVSGETKKNKDALKELGLQYASKKKMWYKRLEGSASKKHKPASIDFIRTKFGSEEIENKGEENEK